MLVVWVDPIIQVLGISSFASILRGFIENAFFDPCSSYLIIRFQFLIGLEIQVASLFIKGLIFMISHLLRYSPHDESKLLDYLIIRFLFIVIFLRFLNSNDHCIEYQCLNEQPLPILQSDLFIFEWSRYQHQRDILMLKPFYRLLVVENDS